MPTLTFTETERWHLIGDLEQAADEYDRLIARYTASSTPPHIQRLIVQLGLQARSARALARRVEEAS